MQIHRIKKCLRIQQSLLQELHYLIQEPQNYFHPPSEIAHNLPQSKVLSPVSHQVYLPVHPSLSHQVNHQVSLHTSLQINRQANHPEIHQVNPQVNPLVRSHVNHPVSHVVNFQVCH